MPSFLKLQKISFPGKLLLVVFFIVLLEGAIRKWLLSSATIPLMALRDFVVLYGVFWGVYKRKFRFDKWQESLLLAWTTLVISWTLLQIVLQVQNLVVGMIGLRGWLLYLWFAVLCFRCLEREELERIISVVLYTLPPMATLAVIQHFMPPIHPINMQPDTPVGEVFIVAQGVVRTTGTFSFTAGYTQYLAFLSPLVLAVLAQPGICSLWLRNIYIVSYLLAVAVSGSRGAIAFAVLMMLAFCYGLVRKGGKGVLRLIYFSLVSIPIAAVIPVFLQSAVDATTTRFEQANESEDVTERVTNMLVGSPMAWENFSLLGGGIGLGSNAAGKFIDGPVRVFILGEIEMDRVLGEGGLLGLFFISAKVLALFLGLYSAHRVIRDDMLPWLFWFFMIPQLITASTMGQITINAFTFLALGIGFVLLKAKSMQTAWKLP